MTSNVIFALFQANQAGSTVKNPPAMQETEETRVGFPKEEIATHSSSLAWRIPWTKEPGRLQYMALQRIRHD